MDVDRITMGGSLKMTIMAEAYSPVVAEATFLVEKKGPITDEDLDALNNSINNKLQEQLRQKLKISLNEFKGVKSNIKKILQD